MALKAKTWELRWPALGIDRGRGHERVYSAVGYPTPWAVNCRLEDALTGRFRGGSFTGISAESKDSPVYRDRAITFSGAVIKVSRQGSQSDFSFSKDVSDMQRPTLFTLAEAGGTGGTVVEVVPHEDRSMLCFTADETWVQQGDPLNGPLKNVSREVGIVAAGGWCKNHDTVYFLSSRGLYSVGADGGGLKALSEERVPEDLVGASGGTLRYKHADRGVYIFPSGADVDWFYDTARDQFWPFTTDTTDSHVLIGPLRIGGPNQKALVQTITGVMAASSATVTWRIIAGDSAEEVCDDGKLAIEAHIADSDYEQYVSAEGAWSTGRAKTAWPRVRGAWIVLWLSSASTWAYESMVLEAVPFGRQRG